MSLRDIFMKKKDAAAQTDAAQYYRQAAEEAGKRLEAFVPRIHDTLEEYFMRLEAGRAPGWLLRRRMECLFTLRNVDAEAFTPAALDTLEGYDFMKELCSSRDIDTAVRCRFFQDGKNVRACFRLAPELRYAYSTFEIVTAAGKTRTFNVDTSQEILSEGAKPAEAPVPQAPPPIETDGSITVKKPLTLKNKPLFS